ncbi:Glycosyltransferase involved in cell wall bisynthesis [Polynucleobacter victoriensis]|uniref:Glycosyltransferase involved in cell wall bisynthesis n=2 Tax=Polynucleobacter victoriensis TaxID=2049319 RepID=A0A212T8H8_9BURK|nr:Glycosyltransferase involved in cell wall bisynthesis [Polynucleobacter victoriensis]
MWCLIVSAWTTFTVFTCKKDRPIHPKLFYAGARSGSLGGPLVKVARLQQVFPEHLTNYNVIYALSNAAYLNQSAVKAIKRKNIPLLVNQNGIFYPGWYSGDWRFMNKKMSIIYHHADYVFWQSTFCKNAANQFLGFREGPGEVLFNAVDTKIFIPTLYQNRPFTFLVAGNMSDDVGYRIFNAIDGFRLARDSGLQAKLLIAGRVSPNLKKAIDEYVRSYDSFHQNICLLGQYEQKNAPSLYAQADAFIMTKYNDSCPNTVIEAMSSGLPIIYSDSGGVPEMVGNQAGVPLKVPQGWDDINHVPSVNDLADAMIYVSKNHAEMSIAARKRAVDKFEITNWLQRHNKIFHHFLVK